MVEPVYGELRHLQGLNRFRRRGTSGVRLEFALHCSAHNIRRYLALRSRAERARLREIATRGLRLLVLWRVQPGKNGRSSTATPVAARILRETQA